MKLRVISDASVLLKCWFYKQAPQKVLIELSPGVKCLYQSFLVYKYFLFLCVRLWFKISIEEQFHLDTEALELVLPGHSDLKPKTLPGTDSNPSENTFP
jgi:hypothetical protein